MTRKRLTGLTTAAAIVLLAIYASIERLPTPERVGAPEAPEASAPSGVTSAQAAFASQRSNVQVTGSGEVIRLLADDREGSRHQRFILRLSNGQTLLVAHNIDLAERIDSLRPGDRVAFLGEYEWNERGGVLHWTHHDPAGRHMDGWLTHQGRRYQ